MRLGELALLRIVITLPQPGVDPGKPALPPLLQLPHRHREPTGQVFDGLALISRSTTSCLRERLHR